MLTLNYLQSAGLGLVAGMRSMMPLAAISDYLMHRPTFDSRFELLGLPQVSTLLKLAALGEIVIDKMPELPARTTLPSLLSRSISGVLAGTAVSAANNKNRLVGGLLGGMGAVISTFGMYHLRRQITEQLDVPDPIVASFEDALAVGGSFGLLALD